MIFEKTKFVEYCIKNTHKIKSVWYLKEGNVFSFFEKRTKMNEKNNPEIAHKKNEVGTFVKRIIFLINMASSPEKISAKNLEKKAFLFINPFLFIIKYEPVIIKMIPKIEARFGISFRKNIPKISATMGL